MKRKIYMCVTHDKYELPVAVADSPKELADMLGVTSNNILSAIYHAKVSGRKSIYVRVVVDDE